MKHKIIKKCWECTTFTWMEVDSTWFQDAYSEFEFAATAGKARYRFFLGLDCEYGERKETFTSIKVRRAKHMDMVEDKPLEPASQVTKEMHDKAFHAIGKQPLLKPWRNRYVKEHDEDFEKLIQLGLAEKQPVDDVVGGNIYFLTELGIKVIISMQPIQRIKKELLYAGTTI